MPSEGEEAPSFILPNQDGEEVSLEDFRGDWVVVYFYPRAGTKGCTAQACSFRDTWDAFADAGIAVVGISDDPVDDLAEFAEEFDLPFDLLSDQSGSVGTAYDSYGEKNVFGNVVTGMFRNTFVIDPEGQLSRSYRRVSPEEHAKDILEDIPAAR